MINTPTTLCTFTVGGMYCGLEVTTVREVLRHQDITPVPGAPAIIGGLINLRGEIITAIRLHRILGVAPEKSDELMNLVVSTSDGPVSLLVEEIGDVVTVSADLFEHLPGSIHSSATTMLRGAYKLEDRLLLAVDIAAVRALAGLPLDENVLAGHEVSVSLNQ